jgi:hypothetical protein
MEVDAVDLGVPGFHLKPPPFSASKRRAPGRGWALRASLDFSCGLAYQPLTFEILLVAQVLGRVIELRGL